MSVCQLVWLWDCVSFNQCADVVIVTSEDSDAFGLWAIRVLLRRLQSRILLTCCAKLCGRPEMMNAADHRCHGCGATNFRLSGISGGCWGGKFARIKDRKYDVLQWFYHLFFIMFETFGLTCYQSPSPYGHWKNCVAWFTFFAHEQGATSARVDSKNTSRAPQVFEEPLVSTAELNAPKKISNASTKQELTDDPQNTLCSQQRLSLWFLFDLLRWICSLQNQLPLTVIEISSVHSDLWTGLDEFRYSILKRKNRRHGFSLLCFILHFSFWIRKFEIWNKERDAARR